MDFWIGAVEIGLTVVGLVWWFCQPGIIVRGLY